MHLRGEDIYQLAYFTFFIFNYWHYKHLSLQYHAFRNTNLPQHMGDSHTLPSWATHPGKCTRLRTFKPPTPHPVKFMGRPTGLDEWPSSSDDDQLVETTVGRQLVTPREATRKPLPREPRCYEDRAIRVPLHDSDDESDSDRIPNHHGVDRMPPGGRAHGGSNLERLDAPREGNPV